jgi:hypothetical protein
MPPQDPTVLEYYTRPGPITSAGGHADRFDPLPRDVAALTDVAHGLVIHEHLAHAYGVTLTDEDRDSVHVRPLARVLDLIVARDDRPLDVPREPGQRVAGNCRHFTVLAVAMLRHQGTPARARCGFGGYFGTGWFEDHWVCEYWNQSQSRWIMVDAQIDDVQREMFGCHDLDTTDVPRDGFLVAGDAWARCRAGQADPGRFGLSMLREAGYWWIAGNLMRDLAALGNVELLPWDVWGAMPAPEEAVAGDLVALFDEVAELTRTPDIAVDEVHRRLEDERLRVPPAVFNALRKRDEPLTD